MKITLMIISFCQKILQRERERKRRVEATTIQINVPITNANKLLIALRIVGKRENTLSVGTIESSITKGL